MERLLSRDEPGNDADDEGDDAFFAALFFKRPGTLRELLTNICLTASASVVTAAVGCCCCSGTIVWLCPELVAAVAALKRCLSGAGMWSWLYGEVLDQEIIMALLCVHPSSVVGDEPARVRSLSSAAER